MLLVFQNTVLASRKGHYTGHNRHLQFDRRSPLQRALIAITRVTARVFHSPVLFGLLFLVSLAAVLITPEHQDEGE